MNIEGTLSRITGTVEKNAGVFAAGAAIYGRFKEDSATPLTAIADYFSGKAAWNVLTELQHTFTDPAGIIGNLRYKLWDSTHAPTQLVKAGLAIYAASEIGVLPSKYATVGKKIAKGAAIAAILVPASPVESQAAFMSRAKPLEQISGYNY